MYKSIQAKIALSECKDKFSLDGDSEPFNRSSKLHGELAATYKGAADDFIISLSGSDIKLEWRILPAPADAERLNQAAIKYAREKKLSQALESWNQAIGLFHKDPDYYYNSGLVSFELKDIKTGIEQLSKVIEICPIYYKAYFVLGSIYSRIRNFDKSKNFLQEGLFLNKDYTLGMINLGAVYSILRQYNDAISIFEKAIAAAPREAKGYLGLGKVYAALGDFDNANRCFKAVVKLDPNGKLGNIARRSLKHVLPEIDSLSDNRQGTIDGNPEEWYALGYQHYIKGNYQDAAKAYSRYLGINSKDGDVWASLAACQLRMGNSDDAVESIKRAVQLQPSKASFYKQAAIIYEACGRHQDVNSAARKAIELGKRDSVLLTLFGKSMITNGNIQEGAKHLQEAIRLNPNNLKARFHFAKALKSMGQLDSARQNFEEILWVKTESPLKEEARKEIQKLV
jgi:tetratricopeptide (TPR) repeat protein